ncbi:MAG: hypothetical protein ACI4CY_03780 [Candidatus Gastranaerophilaceae bacterium]
MRDAFVNGMNTQLSTKAWMDALSENLINMYTPGYRESKMTFKTFLGGAVPDTKLKSTSQGKSTPGTSDENIYLEGTGFFVIRNDKGRIAYTRLGEFKFDGEGVYKTADGQRVQGYILNDKGEIMQGTKPIDADLYEESSLNGGSVQIPTTDIKLWIDPSNGKYLGKYDEFEFKGDGILYGKADKGKIKTPLYKVAIMNFHNPQELYEIKEGQFIETEESGKPVIGRGEVRSGLIELSNSGLRVNSAYFQMADLQMKLSSSMVKSAKSNLQNVIDMIST